MKRSALLALLLLGNISSSLAHHNIRDHGAVHNQTDTDTAFLNAQAVIKAALAANASTTDREVYIPKEENLFFNMMPVHLTNLHNVTFTIDGTVLVSDDNERWPNRTDRNC